MKKQLGMKVEPARVRQAEIVRRLKGVPHTIEEVARLLKLDYYTARRYLAQLYERGIVEKMHPRRIPIRYYAPLRMKHEQHKQTD
jgi:DNA-binding transcriptional ArsR family regulator